MAKGNMMQGQSAGKLGDIVFYVAKGNQQARVYTTSGARSGDAASEAARLQRVRFGAAANQWDLYSYICTRMYRKGKKPNQSDYNYFVKKNIGSFPFLTKEENASGVHVIQPGLFSEGNLGRIELLIMQEEDPATKLDGLSITDMGNVPNEFVAWSDKMGKLKSVLQSMYPNATKVTYLISIANSVEIEGETETFVSQFPTSEKIIIDLLKETTAGENESQVTAYFQSRINNRNLKALIGNQTVGILSLSGQLFNVMSITEADNALLDTMSVLVFATNDNVSDCYTTIVPPENVSSAGAYQAWYGYRTKEALTIAAQTYGFQTGVLKDDIAQFGDTSENLLTKYIAKLSTVNQEAAETLQKQIAESGGIRIKSSRKLKEQTPEDSTPSA